MNIKRALAVRDDAVTRLADAYSSAKCFGLRSRELHERNRAIHAALPKSTPRWVHTYLDGYAAALSRELYRDALVYGLWANGTFYAMQRSHPAFHETLGVSIGEIVTLLSNPDTVSGHFWFDKPDRPFFTD